MRALRNFLAGLLVVGALAFIGGSIPQYTVTVAANNTTLAGLGAAAAASGYVIRATTDEGGAPPLTFVLQSGTCASHSLANDEGNCVDGAQGISWLARPQDGMLDVRQFGAVADGSTDMHTAVQAAITVSEATGACVFLPYSKLGYRTSVALTWSSSNSTCITGTPLTTAQNSTGQRVLILTTDTDCIDTNGVQLSIYDIACTGNGSTSTSPTATIGINETGSNGGYDTKLSNVTLSGYVIGYQPIDRTRGGDLTVDNSALYPNLTNNFPSFCIKNMATGNVVEAVRFDRIFCRDQGYLETYEFTGDGSTTYYDFTLGASSGRTSQANVLWASDGIKACQSLQASTVYPCAPLVPGTDFTLYDCGASACAGSGGTLLPVYVKTASTTASNAQITVASTTGLSAGTAYRVIGEHNLPDPTYVVSVDDSTHVTLSNPPTSTNAAVKYTFFKAGIGATCTGTSPTCAYRLEMRFTTAPPNLYNVEIDHDDPWSYAAVYDANGAEGTYNFEMVGGIRNILHGGCVGCYGQDHLDVTYWEIGNYCMTVDEGGASGYFHASTNNVVSVGRNVRGSNGGQLGTNRRCAMWVPPEGYGNRVEFNGSDWRQYEGTTFNGTTGVSWQIGSDTAPISSTAAKLELSLGNAKCAGGASNLELQASEDGTTWLAGTSYTYELSNQTPASGAYVPLESAGDAAIVLSNGSLNTTSGAYEADIIVGNPGVAKPHPVQIRAQMVDNSAVSRSINGGGTINGTPAKLMALRVVCATAATQPLLGQLWYRERWK